jgi:electron transport complex protein RnfB
MEMEPYVRLARRLDSLPNGFPPTEDGAELRLLAKIFTPKQADLASKLRIRLETPDQLAERLGMDASGLRNRLKEMARLGLIQAGKAETGLGYGLMPFVFGIYEMQNSRLDGELARLFEAYYRQAFVKVTQIAPQIHRILPVGESIDATVEVLPYESVVEILSGWQAWGVLDCICRRQKAMIGEACGHPLDVCMVMSRRPGAFDSNPTIRSLSLDEAKDKLLEASEAGLVHTVGNRQEDVFYICNCCTCSCGLLRGIAEFDMANVVARSSFVNMVDEYLCTGCGLCEGYCQFGALSMEQVAVVDEGRCVGCGVCVINCPDGAMKLTRRPDTELSEVPVSDFDWGMKRAASRGLDLSEML